MVLATQEQLKNWLDEVAYLGQSTIKDDDKDNLVYYSNFNDSYILRYDMLDNPNGIVEALVANEVTEQLTHCTGFSPKNNKWYGWSHRAFYGFTIGSEVKKGDCAYQAFDKEDFMEESLNFWTDEDREDCRVVGVTNKEFQIQYQYSRNIPNKQLRGTTRRISCEFHEKFGRGEWTAETMEDAKQMAFDFAAGVD